MGDGGWSFRWSAENGGSGGIAGSGESAESDLTRSLSGRK